MLCLRFQIDEVVACVRIVSREELYEQVWAKPMTKVTAEYGVTGTALKKTCDRHTVGLEAAAQVPAIRWRRQNHNSLDAEKRAALVVQLERVLAR